MVLILPIEFTNLGSTIVPTGPSIIATYLACFVFTIIDLRLCFFKKKKINKSYRKGLKDRYKVFL